MEVIEDRGIDKIRKWDRVIKEKNVLQSKKQI